jgi:hypothetical protein
MRRILQIRRNGATRDVLVAKETCLVAEEARLGGNMRRVHSRSIIFDACGNVDACVHGREMLLFAARDTSHYDIVRLSDDFLALTPLFSNVAKPSLCPHDCDKDHFHGADTEKCTGR